MQHVSKIKMLNMEIPNNVAPKKSKVTKLLSKIVEKEMLKF